MTRNAEGWQGMPAAASPQRPLRALVVAYDFPPHAAIGTMRTLRLVQQLAQEGWDVRVLTSDPRTFRPGTAVDDQLLARVPASVMIVRAGVLRGLERLKRVVRSRPHAERGPSAAAARRTQPRAQPRGFLAQTLDVVEAALAIPDHESGWFLPAVTRGIWSCRGWRPDIVYSSSPPWTGHAVAAALAAALGRPWVADFRDPWARAPWRVRRAFVRRANEWLEHLVIRRADAVLFVTRANRDEFAAFYGTEIARRFHLVPNGCDPSEFEGLAPRRTQSDPFVLLHAGTLYGARNPLPLIQAIARAIGRGALVRETFRLRLLGSISLDIDLAAECRALGLEDVVEMIPRVTRGESLRQMVSASALLLVQPVTTVSVPGKAYEYVAAGRPLLALSEEGETAHLVRASGIGVSVQPDAGVEAIERALLQVIELASRPFARPPVDLYDGRVHAAATAELLTQLVSGRRGRAFAKGTTANAATGVGIAAEEPRQ
jgi:glycosyltransferase involved in cell wall biosynthesis